MERNPTAVRAEIVAESRQVRRFQAGKLAELLLVDQKIVRKRRVENDGKSRGAGS
jgi:hypothetical protein